MEKEKFKILVDRNGKYVDINFNIADYIVNREYSIYHCDIPELYPIHTTLEGIDDSHCNCLMDDFKDIGCELKVVEFT